MNNAVYDTIYQWEKTGGTSEICSLSLICCLGSFYCNKCTFLYIWPLKQKEWFKVSISVECHMQKGRRYHRSMISKCKEAWHSNWMSNISHILKIWEIHPPPSLFLQIYSFALQNCQGRKGELVLFDHPTPHLTLLLFIFVWAWFQPHECQCFHINWELGISSFPE